MRIDMIIRLEEAADAEAICHITQQAFDGAAHSSGTEGAIIDGLRAAGTLTLSLVAEKDGEIVGHVAFSPVTVDGRDVGWFGLGPISVKPGFQRSGTGGRLIREGLARLRSDGAKGCVVLGDPGYYHRFGFETDPAMTFEGVPPEYFMVLPFIGSRPTGQVTYQPAFYLT
ncbi:N-acetyltransferase [Rhodobacter sp. KR11]|uniref:GNAT family N-acetyltransferase n=1 Tax=Rhodobacter sp. KR11 TaxID=2974588 RepID=UPI002222895F|nr:N-acetyltransferase [Rhodobacter sp. KR11]MCW1917531.1 N-acetyltransferase [Rhodobacter sp. KR11]